MTERKSTEPTTRIQRGIRIAAERGAEVVETGAGTYRVPGSAGATYTVDLDRAYCSCPDHAKRGFTCKHIFAAEIVASRRACRRRKTAAKPDRRHKGDSLKGILTDLDRLSAVAARVGV